MSNLCAGVLDEVDATIRSIVARIGRREPRPRSLLDVGCWDGTSSARYASLAGCAACGIEVFDAPAAAARARGIGVETLDLERGAFPWPDETFDVVIANQVFEHLKNVWLPMAEILRVTRTGGTLVFSVPNLASLHNRVLMAFGAQPTSVRTLGPHVRGFTMREARRFVGLGGRFEIECVRGVGFYPLPARLARPLAALWRGASHTTVIVARKRPGSDIPPWLAHIDREQASGLQTSYR